MALCWHAASTSSYRQILVSGFQDLFVKRASRSKPQPPRKLIYARTGPQAACTGILVRVVIFAQISWNQSQTGRLLFMVCCSPPLSSLTLLYRTRKTYSSKEDRTWIRSSSIEFKNPCRHLLFSFCLFVVVVDNIFHLDVHYVCMLVQRFEPEGRRLPEASPTLPLKRFQCSSD